MKAMILAAGRGERMRPLTDHLPKPLLPVAGKPMIEYTIESLAAAGFQEIVINLAHLGNKIEKALGNGSRFHVKIQYTHEGDTGLETAGGIINALPLLGNEPFLVVNGDIATDYPFAELRNKISSPAHLVLVPNPEHHPEGDFGLDAGIVTEVNKSSYTFSGIGIYRAALFNACKPGKTRLAPILRQAISEQKVTGEVYTGFWMDIGTRERLNELDSIQKQRIKS